MNHDWKVIDYLKSKYIKVKKICSKNAKINNIISDNIATKQLIVNGINIVQNIVKGEMTPVIIPVSQTNLALNSQNIEISPSEIFKSFDAGYSMPLAPNNNINDCIVDNIGGTSTSTSIEFQLNITNSTTIYRLILLGVIRYTNTDDNNVYVYNPSTLTFVNLGENPSYESYIPYSYFRNYNIAIPENVNNNNPIITVAPNTIFLNTSTDLVIGGALLNARQYAVEFLTILHGEITSDFFPLITHHTYTTSRVCLP